MSSDWSLGLHVGILLGSWNSHGQNNSELRLIVSFAAASIVLRRSKHGGFALEVSPSISPEHWQSFLAKPSGENQVILQLLLGTIRSFLQSCLLYVLLLGSVVPILEIAAGGSHNLHFLSHEAQRAISPLADKSKYQIGEITAIYMAAHTILGRCVAKSCIRISLRHAILGSPEVELPR